MGQLDGCVQCRGDLVGYGDVEGLQMQCVMSGDCGWYRKLLRSWCWWMNGEVVESRLFGWMLTRGVMKAEWQAVEMQVVGVLVCNCEAVWMKIGVLWWWSWWWYGVDWKRRWQYGRMMGCIIARLGQMSRLVLGVIERQLVGVWMLNVARMRCLWQSLIVWWQWLDGGSQGWWKYCGFFVVMGLNWWTED